MQRSAYSRSTLAGADYVGSLPAELLGYVDFAVGVLAVSKQRGAAQALVKFMSWPIARNRATTPPRAPEGGR